MFRALAVVVVLSLGGGAGCLRTSERLGAAVSGDAASGDVASDGRRDSNRDAPQITEAGVDPVDTIRDGDGPIAAPDVALLDGPTDSSIDAKQPRDIGAVPDKPPPLDSLAVNNACSANATQAFSYPSTNMRICTSMVASDQCLANKLCNAAGGWSLCTPSQFRSRGGETTPSAITAWISACIASTSGPSATPCTPCTNASVALREIAWPCTGGSPNVQTSSDLFIGVATSTICRRVGLDDPKNGAFWQPRNATQTLDSAVCCK